MNIKICGLVDCDEVRELDKLEIDYGGVWWGIPKGRYELSDKQAKVLLSQKTQCLKLVLVTFESSLERIDALVNDTQAHAVQLHGFQLPSLIKQLKRKFDDRIKIMKVLHVSEEECMEDNFIDRYVDVGTDYFIFDTFISKNNIGSTGKPLNLRFPLDYVHKIHQDKIIIAGGIGADTIATIYDRLQPHGVDMDSSVRIGNALNYEQVARMAVKAHSV